MTQKEQTYHALLERAFNVVNDHGNAELTDHPVFLAIKQILETGRHVTHKHKKRGTYYTVIGRATLQSANSITEGHDLTIYRAQSDNTLWARPTDEFNDGRFEVIE